MNIKGKLQLWLKPGVKEGDYLEVPLKECHAFTRPGCNTCPDFAAEHADISMGGLGQTGGWTLTIIRTDLGRQIFDEMVEAGWVESKNAVDEDPAAVALMRKLAAKSRKRWPVTIGSGRPDTETRPGVIESA
jgi:coenzyme F420 hydrogenase subunit beta